MKNPKVLIIGGKGKTGRRVADRLTEKGVATRIVSRSTSPAFDWENRETWAAAVEGMDMVYVTFQPDLAVPGSQEAIKAFTELAIKSGIQKIVLLSGRGEKEAQLCEDIVINSGIRHTIVRADWFNQNFSESFFLEPIQAGYVALPRSETPIAFVDADDIADVVVESLLNPKNDGKIHELTGPRLWTFAQVLSEVAKATGRDIQFHPVEIDEYIQMLRTLQLPEDFLWLINYLFSEVLDGRNATTTDGVEKALGRKPKDLSDFVKETAGSGVWSSEVFVA